MIYRIAVTGTESTGKTTLCEALAEYYNTGYVPDISRSYIGRLKRAYNESDVLEIAREIIKQEDQMLQSVGTLLLSDNDLINIKIWLQYYQWEVPQWLLLEMEQRKTDLYLLCNIDLPWVADEQRANPNDRTRLFHCFKSELAAIQANYVLISGNRADERLALAKATINRLVHK